MSSAGRSGRCAARGRGMKRQMPRSMSAAHVPTPRSTDGLRTNEFRFSISIVRRMFFPIATKLRIVIFPQLAPSGLYGFGDGQRGADLPNCDASDTADGGFDFVSQPGLAGGEKASNTGQLLHHGLAKWSVG